MPQLRANVLIFGEVQGVYFRGTTRGLALANDLRGWVRNRADGSVEAVFEGEEAAVRDLVAWCHDGPRLADVERVEVAWEQPTGEFRDFSVR